MPDDQPTQVIENQQFPGSSVQKSIGIDYQKYISDTEPLLNSFYAAFSGWRVWYKKKMTHPFGIEKIVMVEQLTVDKDNRYMDEMGASWLYNSCIPLINHILTSGNLSDDEIRQLWDAKLTTIIMSIAKSVHNEKNPYHIKIDRGTDIITQLGILAGITRKAKDGWTLEKLSSTFNTIEMRRMGYAPEEKKGNLLDRIINRGKNQ